MCGGRGRRKAVMGLRRELGFYSVYDKKLPRVVTPGVTWLYLHFKIVAMMADDWKSERY